MSKLVTIKCYGQTDKMERKKAMDFYLDCMCGCEGAERERYAYIVSCLRCGDNYIDGDDY